MHLSKNAQGELYQNQDPSTTHRKLSSNQFLPSAYKPLLISYQPAKSVALKATIPSREIGNLKSQTTKAKATVKATTKLLNKWRY